MKIYTKILMVISVLFFISCSDWLNVEQEGEIESESLFKSGDGYRVVLNGLYKAMGAPELYGRELSFGMVDCMSQQYDLSDEEANQSSIYKAFVDFKYKDNDVTTLIDNTWLAGFKVIANTNDLIQNISDASADLFEFGEMERDLIMGEAYACRALMHFDLLRLFAPALVNDDQGTYVPYVEDYPNIHATSMQVKPFLDKVIADLLKAKSLVASFDTTEIGVKVNSTAAARTSLSPDNFAYGDFFAGRVYRLSYYSITALLARVYQYADKSEEAFACAKEVVEFGTQNGGAVFYKDDFTGIMSSKGDGIEAFDQRADYKAKSSIIFSAYNKKAYEQSDIQRYFQLRAQNWSNVYFVLDRVALFNNRGMDEWEQDIRSSYMVFMALGNYPVSGKWFVNSTNPEQSEHLKMSPVIRLTEMKYIMAEYYAAKGLYDEAYKILDDIRSARNIEGKLTVRNNFSDFVTDLIGDARREWISEGQLFYLYKRLDAPFMKNDESHKLTRAEASLPLPTDQK